jgi:pSer/pThr/pTyr-binding forkhead associated (FHA) protein
MAFLFFHHRFLDSLLRLTLVSSWTVSGAHAKIEAKDDKVYITDLDSTNGTYIDSKKISSNTPVELKPGSVVVFGKYLKRSADGPTWRVPAKTRTPFTSTIEDDETVIISFHWRKAALVCAF